MSRYHIVGYDETFATLDVAIMYAHQRMREDRRKNPSYYSDDFHVVVKDTRSFPSFCRYVYIDGATDCGKLCAVCSGKMYIDYEKCYECCGVGYVPSKKWRG